MKLKNRFNFSQNHLQEPMHGKESWFYEDEPVVTAKDHHIRVSFLKRISDNLILTLEGSRDIQDTSRENKGMTNWLNFYLRSHEYQRSFLNVHFVRIACALFWGKKNVLRIGLRKLRKRSQKRARQHHQPCECNILPHRNKIHPHWHKTLSYWLFLLENNLGRG